MIKDIHIINTFTSKRGESSYSKNKEKYIRYEIIGKSLNPIL